MAAVHDNTTRTIAVEAESVEDVRRWLAAVDAAKVPTHRGLTFNVVLEVKFGVRN